MDQNNNPNAKYYRSLTRKMMFTVIIVSFAPMILVSGVIFNQFRDVYKDKAYAHLSVLIKRHQHNIDNFLNEKMNDIRFLAKTFRFEELNDESFLRNKLAILQQEYDTVIEDLGVINEQGIQSAYHPAISVIDQELEDLGWWIGVMDNVMYELIITLSKKISFCPVKHTYAFSWSHQTNESPFEVPEKQKGNSYDKEQCSMKYNIKKDLFNHERY